MTDGGAVRDALADTLLAHRCLGIRDGAWLCACECRFPTKAAWLTHRSEALLPVVQAECKRQTESLWLRIREAHDWQCDCDPDDPCRMRVALTAAHTAEALS